MRELCHYCLKEMVASYAPGPTRDDFQARLDAAPQSPTIKCDCTHVIPVAGGLCRCQCACEGEWLITYYNAKLEPVRQESVAS